MSSFSEVGSGSQSPGYDFLPGQLVLNTWEVLEPLGRGGMGAVYRVYHRFLQKEMAMKTLRPDQVNDVTWRRFHVEAKAIAKLEHPNIVQIFDMGTAEGGQPFYTMELLNGQGLDRWIRHEPLTVAQAIIVFRQVASALAFAHERGIIHRDIKPANIVLGFSEENRPPVVKVVDFGIARLGLESQGLTKEGEVFGSPLYMSPEQASGMKVDQRSDVYSLGCAFYETLTGFPPFKGKTAFETMMMHLDKAPLPLELARPDLKFPPGLSAIVQMLLAKNPDQRYSNASQIAQDLAQIEQGLGRKVASRLQTASQSRLEDFLEADEQQGTEQLTSPLLPNENSSGVSDEAEAEESFGELEREASGKRRAVFFIGMGLFIAVVLGVVIFFSGGKSSSLGVKLVDSSKCYFLDAGQMEALKKEGHQFKHGWKYYNFSTSSSECIGDICKIPQDGVSQEEWLPAQGLVGISSGEKFLFRPSMYFMAHPELWQKFRTNDLQCVCFPLSKEPAVETDFVTGYTLSRENIEPLARFELLESINLGDGVISARSAEIIGKFQPLRHLYFSSDSHISASNILNMDCVRFDRLTELAVPRLAEPSSLIVFLGKSQHIEDLTIPFLDATPADMISLGNIKSLVSLSLCGGRLPRGALKELSRLPKLEELRLSNTVCPSEEVDGFLKLSHLKRLVLSEDVCGKDGIHLGWLEKQLRGRGIKLEKRGSVVNGESAQMGALKVGSLRPVNSHPSSSAASVPADKVKADESLFELIVEPEKLPK